MKNIMLTWKISDTFLTDNFVIVQNSVFFSFLKKKTTFKINISFRLTSKL